MKFLLNCADRLGQVTGEQKLGKNYQLLVGGRSEGNIRELTLLFCKQEESLASHLEVTMFRSAVGLPLYSHRGSG